MARTDEELFTALLHLRADPLDPDIPDDVLDEMVRAEGGNPDDLVKSALATVEAESERHRLSWQEEARRTRDLLDRRAQSGRRSWEGVSADELLAEVEARKNNPKFAQPIALAARKRTPGQKPNAEELRMLLEDLDELEAMATDEGDDPES